MMDRRGRVDAEGPTEGDAFDAASTREVRPARQRTSPAQFAREVRDELRQVAWPTRAEMINYTTVVFFTLVLMISLIFLLNYVFGKAVFFMFQK
jgi:preprotein translocase subunit SecE